MKTYISVNIVARALIFLSAVKEHNCNRVSDAMKLKLPYGINKSAAFAFAEQCKWLSINEDFLSISTSGVLIISLFDGDSVSCSLWKQILSDYIEVCHPAWASRIPFGRKEAYLFMNSEEQRCFDEAGLMHSTDIDVIEWWDNLAQIERSKRNLSLVDIGRTGEALTVRYERQRTGLVPIWVSVESNLAGYDILSYHSSQNHEQLMIEVKTTTSSLDKATFILTRNEWDTALRRNNYERYYFYLWVMNKNGSHLLARISARELAGYIPTDVQNGRWLEAQIPFNSFCGKYQKVFVALE